MWISAHRAATLLDRLQQPLDEIAVHRAGVAAGTVLQHAEAIDHDIGLLLPQQPRQRFRIHRQDRPFDIERGGLLRGRKAPGDAGDLKAPRAQVVGDEPADQSGGAEHQDVAERDRRS